MGAWGVNALDSDQALDWLGGHITDQVGAEVMKVVNAYHRLYNEHDPEYAADYIGMELRAAAHVVTTLNYFSYTLFGDLHQICADSLELLRDSKWVDEWNEPDLVRASIQAQIDACRAGQQTTTLFENLEKLNARQRTTDTPTDPLTGEPDLG